MTPKQVSLLLVSKSMYANTSFLIHFLPLTILTHNISVIAIVISHNIKTVFHLEIIVFQKVSQPIAEYWEYTFQERICSHYSINLALAGKVIAFGFLHRLDCWIYKPFTNQERSLIASIKLLVERTTPVVFAARAHPPVASVVLTLRNT